MPGVLTALAKPSAAATCGLSHTWTESFWLAATAPVAWVRLVNGTALPGTRATAGVGEALANPLAPVIVVPMIAAVAPVAAISDLVLDMAPLTVLWFIPRAGGRRWPSPCLCIPSGNSQERRQYRTVTNFRKWRAAPRFQRSRRAWASSR